MKVVVVIFLFIISIISIIGIERCSPAEHKTVVAKNNEYAGNGSCKSCHQQEHAEWSTSHHYMAMQPANDSTVLGDFNNASLKADGVTSRFFKKEGKFYINTEGEDGKYKDFAVKYTFGFTPLQQYLIEFPGGRMQPTRDSWDTKKKKWFHQYSGQKIPAGDWLHWTGNGQNWNTMCATCHSTNLQKGYDMNSDTYKTTFNEINVSCESCHGQGKNHIDYINSSEYQAGNKSIGSMLRMFKGEGQVMQVNNCGNCHARRADITGAVLPGAEFMNDFIPELPTNTFFYADGQMNDEDYNFTSFLQSKMFHRGVQCTNCHNPHTGNLKFTASAVCSQCHAPDTFNIPSHTMHAENSEGSSCINCHMPSKLYMGVDLRHDHSFRIPRPDLTVKYGTPNTCNSCHKDKPAKWAEQIIKKNFGDKRKYHFSEDLIPGSRMDANSEAHLNKLLQDTATPNIIRATVLDYMSRMNNTNGSTIFIKHLTDTSAMVRFRSLKGLLSYDPSLWISYAGPLLQDPVRAVRIAAAELFMTIPPREVPPSLSAAFSNAKAEQERFIIYQTDFAQGNAQAGDFYRQQNDFLSAENFYKKAIAKDSQLTIARVNLASTLNANGKNEAALQQLLAAQKIEPASDHIYYNLALLYVEMKQPEAAEKAFQKAIALHTDNIKVYYNYALFLQQTGKTAEAEKIYLKALKMEPANGDVLYALTVMYMQQKNILKATETARKLKQYHGNNPNYQQLLQQLHV